MLYSKKWVQYFWEQYTTLQYNVFMRNSNMYICLHSYVRVFVLSVTFGAQVAVFVVFF